MLYMVRVSSCYRRRKRRTSFQLSRIVTKFLYAINISYTRSISLSVTISMIAIFAFYCTSTARFSKISRNISRIIIRCFRSQWFLDNRCVIVNCSSLVTLKYCHQNINKKKFFLSKIVFYINFIIPILPTNSVD